MSIVKSASAFTREEYLGRLKETKRQMANKGVDVLLVQSFSNIIYLTGYTAPTEYVAQLLVVDLREEEPDLYLRLQDAPAGKQLSFMSADHVVGYPEEYIGNPTADPYDYMLSRLAARVRGKVLGIELQALAFPTGVKLQSQSTAASTVDCSLLVDYIRAVKSDSEIAVMREAARIAEMGVARATAVICEGARECDVAAEVISVLIRGRPDPGTTNICVPFISSTPRTGTPHYHWTSDRYRLGTQINTEIGGSSYRYAAGIMRTFHIGPAPDRLKRLHEAEMEGMEAALAAARPGALCAEVATAFQRAIKHRGFEKQSRCGYGIGINWVEQTASLNVLDKTVLKPNMTFHLMLGNWIDDDFGYMLSETIRITEQGCEVLTQSPRDLIICPARTNSF